jgi:ABC-type oligopeptide transport system ATPase subunit
MDKNSKGYIAIAGITVVSALAGFLVVKKLKDKRAEKKGNQTRIIPNTVNNSNGSYNGGNSQPTIVPKASYFNAKAVADKLLKAMDGTGTDEDAVLRALRELGQGQLQKVISAFGKPHYFAGRLNKTFGSPKDLIQWLKEEHDSDELKPIKEIFTQHGIIF